MFHHWQIVPGDPLDKSVVVRPLEAQVRCSNSFINLDLTCKKLCADSAEQYFHFNFFILNAK